MSVFVPTTTISILRGTSTNFAGDEQEASTVIQAHVPASLLEQRRQVTNPVDGNPRTVRFTTARVFSTVDITKGDLVLDEQTSGRWKAESVHRNSSAVHAADLVIDLSRVN